MVLHPPTPGCRIIHFTGHGTPGAVTFEDTAGAMYLLNARGLRELFAVGDGAQGVEFVFVSACHSQDVGLAFVAAGVPHVVAVKTDDEVLDKASLEFAKQFYTALLSGKSVSQAFEVARTAVKWDPDITNKAVEADKFLLLGSGSHDTARIFSNVPRGDMVDMSRPIKNK